jgi:Alkylmercury lyase
MSRIVGASDTQTVNRVMLQTGQEAYLRCGADILLSGLYYNLVGEAICPVCGTKVRVSIENKQIVSVSPLSAVLHYAREDVGDSSKFCICCSDTFIFDKEECLKTWLRSYHGSPGKLSSLQEFMKKASSRRK